MKSVSSEKFCGQIVTKEQLEEIIEIIETFPKLSHTELASTVCELFSWKRPTGKLKSVECRQFLERLDEKGTINLPACREQYAKRGTAKVPRTKKADIQPTISAKLKELSPVLLIKVETREQRQLWYEYVDRYHYLGYQLPFGAQSHLPSSTHVTPIKNPIPGCLVSLHEPGQTRAGYYLPKRIWGPFSTS